MKSIWLLVFISSCLIFSGIFSCRPKKVLHSITKAINVKTENIQRLENEKLQKNFNFVNNFFSYSDSILFKKSNYQAVIDSLEKYENTVINTGDFGKKSFYYQTIMTYSAFIDHNKALYYEDKAFPRKNTNSIILNSDLKPVKAIDFISTTYSNKKIILVNEAHGNSQTRAFIRDLILELNQKGYNYLGVESLEKEDTTISKFGIPTLRSGFYLKDPIFANSLRFFSKNNNVIFPYDFDNLDTTIVAGFNGQHKRDRDQYKNIKSIISKNPSSKFIIWAGHDHIHKSNTNNWKKMGEYLYDEFKTDLVSIDCTLMREKNDTLNENPFYRKAKTKFFNLDEPFVLLNQNEPFVSPGLINKVDLNVFFPQTKYIDEIPNWYFPKKVQSYKVKYNFKKGDFIQIFYLHEYLKFKNMSIPVFQKKINSNMDFLNLNLNSGSYLIRVLNNNNITTEKEFKVN